MSYYDLNQVQLLGRCGDLPKIFRPEKKQPFATVSIATNKKWRKDNVIHTRTDWHNVVFNNKLADIVEKYLDKGDLILVTGELRTRKWQNKDGKDQYSTFVQVKELRLLASKPKQEKESVNTPSIEPVSTNTDEVEEDFLENIPF